MRQVRVRQQYGDHHDHLRGPRPGFRSCEAVHLMPFPYKTTAAAVVLFCHKRREGNSKLLFSKINAVIASQCAHWRGNPPDEWNQVAITTKNRNNPHFSGAIRYIFPLTGGLPHQCAHWFAMTGNLQRTLSNNNFSYCSLVFDSLPKKPHRRGCIPWDCPVYCIG